MSHRKSAIEQALEFSSKQPTFSCEDTSDRCYRDVIEAIEGFGWKRIPHKKKTKVEMKRIPIREGPRLISTLNENDIDFNEVQEHQICNHFEGIHQLTTKQGFCEISKDLHYQSTDGLEITPRCYNLGDPMHRDEFIDDFRLNAAIVILKYFIAARVAKILHVATASSNVAADSDRGTNVSAISYKTRKNQLLELNIHPASALLKNVLFALNWHIRLKFYGEWPEVDISKYFKDKSTSLTDIEWHEILCKSYELIATIPREDDFVLMNCLLKVFPIPRTTTIQQRLYQGFTTFDIKLVGMLDKLRLCNPQFFMDGYRNIWIVKSPDTSCGIGMKLSCRLDEIFELERKMTGRVVQKYIEIPLLAPIHSKLTHYLYHQMSLVESLSLSDAEQEEKQRQHNRQIAFNSMLLNAKQSKFDLRIWVLVTSFQSNPVQAYIYPTVYGRRCGSEYSGEISTLNDHLVHLTNYTLQKKNVVVSSMQDQSDNAFVDSEVGNSRKDREKDRSSGTGSAKRLRGLCKDARGSRNVNGTNNSNIPVANNHLDVELLIKHEELMDILDLAFYQAKQSDHLSPDLRSKVKRGEIHTHVWKDHIWPIIKSKVTATLECVAMKLKNPRKRSYELLGYDVILDQYFNPYILEVNMSPAMAHRNKDQSQLIQNMSRKMVALAIVPHLDDLSKDNFTAWLSNGHLSSRQMTRGTGNRNMNDSSAVDMDGMNDDDDVDHDIQEEVKLNRDWEPIFPSFDIVDPMTGYREPGESEQETSASTAVDPMVSSANRRKSFNSNPQLENDHIGAHSAMGLVAIGKQISNGSIEYIDFLCKQLEKVLILQQWFRIHLVRVRRYHFVRRMHATTIQCKVRQYLAMRLRRTLFHKRCREWIEETKAIKLKYFVLQHWYCRHKVYIIWSAYSQYKLRKLKYQQYLHQQASKVQTWYRCRRGKEIFSAFGQIVSIMRKYKKWCLKCWKIVVLVMKLLLRYRSKAKRLKTKAIAKWVDERKFIKAQKKIQLKKVALEAQKKLKNILLQRERQRQAVESNLMLQADDESNNFRMKLQQQEERYKLDPDADVKLPTHTNVEREGLMLTGDHFELKRTQSFKSTSSLKDMVSNGESTSQTGSVVYDEPKDGSTNNKAPAYSSEAMTLEEFLNRPFDEMIEKIQRQIPPKAFLSNNKQNRNCSVESSTATHGQKMIGLISSTDDDDEVDGKEEEDHEVIQRDFPPHDRTRGGRHFRNEEEYSILDFIDRFDPDKQRQRIILQSKQKVTKKMKSSPSGPSPYSTDNTSNIVAGIAAMKARAATAPGELQRQLEGIPVKEPDPSQCNNSSLRSLSAHPSNYKKMANGMAYALSAINVDIKAYDTDVLCTQKDQSVEEQEKAADPHPMPPNDSMNVPTVRGRPHRPYVMPCAPAIDQAHGNGPTPPLSPPFPPGGPRDPRSEFFFSGDGVKNTENCEGTNFHTNALYSSYSDSSDLPYAPQSLHSVLLGSKQSSFSMISRQNLSSFAYGQQPNAGKSGVFNSRPSAIGIEDFFSHTLEQPSPSPQYCLQESSGAATSSTKRNKKNEANTTSGTNRIRRDSFDSATDRSIGSNRTKKSASMKPTSDVEDPEGINPIPSPKKKKPPPSTLPPSSQPPRPSSSGARSKNSRSASKELKKDRIASIYMHK